MQAYPHHYLVKATGNAADNITLTSDRLTPIESAPPAEFGGPGDLWSPETFLVAAVADCFLLTFRGIARASKLTWNSLECEVDGILDKADGQSRFIEFRINATLEVPADVEEARAVHLLEKAEAGCLITASLTSVVHLDTHVRHSDQSLS